MLEKFNFSDSFFTYVIHFLGQSYFLSTSNFLLPRNNFQLFQLSTYINNKNHLSVLLRP